MIRECETFMKLKILIAGAGMGGLAAASSLMKAGHDVEVYEQAPELGEVGAGIQMSANAMHALIDLGLREEISRVAVNPGAYVFSAFDTGEEISRFNLADDHEKLHGAPYCQMHRADFHDILARRAQSVKSDVVRLNHAVTGFTEDSRSDAEIRERPVGPWRPADRRRRGDRIRRLRRQIAGDAPATYTGDCAWRITLPVEDLPADFLPQVMSVFMGPRRACGVLLPQVGRESCFNFVGLVGH